MVTLGEGLEEEATFYQDFFAWLYFASNPLMDRLYTNAWWLVLIVNHVFAIFILLFVGGHILTSPGYIFGSWINLLICANRLKVVNIQLGGLIWLHGCYCSKGSKIRLAWWHRLIFRTCLDIPKQGVIVSIRFQTAVTFINL